MEHMINTLRLVVQPWEAMIPTTRALSSMSLELAYSRTGTIFKRPEEGELRAESLELLTMKKNKILLIRVKYEHPCQFPWLSLFCLKCYLNLSMYLGCNVFNKLNFEN